MRPPPSPHPLDMLEQAVEDNGWHFERAGRDELNLSVAGRWADHHFNFTWRDDLQSLHLSSAFDMRISDDVRRSNVADLLMYVNARLWIGHFDLWPEDGTVVYRHAMIFPDASASGAQCEALLNLAVEACEHYYPAFQFRAVGRQVGPGSDRRRRARMRGAGIAAPVLLIGAGRMGGAMLEGWLAGGLGPVLAVEPHPSQRLRRLEDVRFVADIGQVPPGHLRACVVALKPQILKAQAPALRPIAQRGVPMISIAAGISIATLAKAWGREARILRAMPNTPGAIGRGITALYAAPKTTAADRRLASACWAHSAKRSG